MADQAEDQSLENGATVLWSGKAPIKADVVFVHGLRGNGINTWRKGDVVWPKDLLPKSLPNIRVITWCYDADVMQFFSAPSQNSIHKHADNLLVDLSVERSEDIEQDRPIIFVCHSLGGLVIKQALCICHERESHGGDEGDSDKIIRNTVGIIFLGTPHRGSDAAKWATIATNLAKLLRKDHNDKLIEALSRGSSVLETLQSTFSNTSLCERFAFWTFSEEREYPQIGKIVEDDSAVLYYKRETRSSIPANHSDMCKFGAVNETGFKRVVHAIKSLLRVAGAKNLKKTESSQSQISGASSSQNDGLGSYARPSIPQAQSYGLYAYGGYPQDRGFPQFRFSPYGQDRALEQQEHERLLTLGYPSVDGFASLSTLPDRGSIQRSVSEAGAPPAKLTSRSSDEGTLVNKVEPLDHRDDNDGEREAVQSAAELPEQEAEKASDVPSPITRDMYVRLVQEFSDRSQTPDETFEMGLKRIAAFRREELDRIFERKVVQKARTKIEETGVIPYDLSSQISKRISERSSKNLYCNPCGKPPQKNAFHCVVCNNDDYDICQSCRYKGVKCPGAHPLVRFSVPAVTDESEEKVDPLPENESLFPMQEDVTEHMDEHMQGFDIDSEKYILRTIYLATLLRQNEIVVQIVQWGIDTGILINRTIDLGSTEVQLTPLAIGILMHHDEIVSTILTSGEIMDLVNVDDPDEMDGNVPCSDSDEQSKSDEKKTRASENEKANNDSEADSKSDGADSQGGEDTEGEEDGEDEEENEEEEIAGVEAICAAAKYGTAEATKMLLLQRALDGFPTSYSILHQTVNFGQPETLDVLLSWGVDIEELDDNDQTALHAAAVGANTEAVENLIRRKANVDVQDTSRKTPLHHAVASRKVNIVEMLLWGKASVEIQDSKGKTPIHYAVEQLESPEEQKRMVKCLIEYGAKQTGKSGIDIQDEQLKTAIHYAAAQGRLEIVEILLQGNPNLNLEDGEGQTPLHYVVEKPEHYAIAKALLQGGASLKHKNKAGLQALDVAYASKAGNQETVFLLAGSKVARWLSKKF